MKKVTNGREKKRERGQSDGMPKTDIKVTAVFAVAVVAVAAVAVAKNKVSVIEEEAYT
jgi:hypothetical protein